MVNFILCLLYLKQWGEKNIIFKAKRFPFSGGPGSDPNRRDIGSRTGSRHTPSQTPAPQISQAWTLRGTEPHCWKRFKALHPPIKFALEEDHIKCGQ